MCYAPNLVSRGKFLGGLKRMVNTNSAGKPRSAKDKIKTQEIIKEKLKSGELQLVPCGQCLQCRIDYARNWAARCEVETHYHKHSYFVTLTYNEEEVPVHNMATGEEYRGVKDPVAYVQGVTVERMTLKEKDVQDFLKRLRINATRGKFNLTDDDKKIAYYYCGEYGSKTLRPHYHFILYGVEIPDLKEYSRGNGNVTFTSELLERTWGHGFAVIGFVSYQSCQYVARYVIKKHKGLTADFYKDRGLTPEYVRMSTKPSIGFKYWQEHSEEIYNLDKIYLAEGRKQKPPRYFDLKEDELWKMIEADTKELMGLDPEEGDQEETGCGMKSHRMKEITRARRKRANDKLFAELAKTTKQLQPYMEAKQAAFESKHKAAEIRDGIKAPGRAKG